MPKISIIIPVYNVEKYLDKCVQAARNQTLQDVEIILVDDESPDNCPQLCDEYARQDNRIKVVHKKNGGLGFARNSGLDVAVGEYVTFLDSDDFVDLDTYEHLCTLLSKYKADALYYKLNRFYDDKEVKNVCRKDEVALFNEGQIKDLMLDIIASDMSVRAEHQVNCSSCTAIYRLDIIKQHNIRFYSERELISEDMVFNLDYLNCCSKVAFNDTEHYHYRFNLQSLTNTIRLDRVEKNIELYNFIKERLDSWNLDRMKGTERASRMFIGYSRSFMNPILKSSKTLKEKNDWLDKTLSMPIWNELYSTFPWNKLPLYAKIHFLCCSKKIKVLLFLIAYMR